MRMIFGKEEAEKGTYYIEDIRMIIEARHASAQKSLALGASASQFEMVAQRVVRWIIFVFGLVMWKNVPAP